MSSRFKFFGLVAMLLLGITMPVSSTTPPVASETLAMVSVPSPTPVSRPVELVPEQLLIEALGTFRAGNVDGAMKIVDDLLETQPTYRLAHLLRGDLLAARAGIPLSVERGDDPRDRIDNLLAEARQRWAGRNFATGGRLPAPLIHPGARHRSVVFVDLALSRLFLFENQGGQLELIDTFYVSAGKNGVAKRRKGDKKTPLGVYFVTERLPGELLPDKYGPVAFPVSYPNEWDRRHGRTGSGIWLHGVASSNYSRPPLDSDGCVALTNDELSRIAPRILPGVTPVVIGYNIPWLDSVEIRARAAAIEQAVEDWRAAWESGDTGTYLEFYADDFEGRGMNKGQWSAYKRRVNNAKKYMRIELTDVSVFGYPDEDDMVVVTFEQQYSSDNFNSESRKRQYWRRDASDGRWRIVAEVAANAG